MNDKFSDMKNKMDGRMFKYKMEKALETLKSESPEALKRKLAQLDVQDVMQKMDEYDQQRLKEMGVDINNLKQKINNTDIQKLVSALGPNESEALIRKLREFLYN